MKIQFKNVGLLNTAEIDLSKDLIVLTGPNNTGKTYAAYSVYGLYKFNQLDSFNGGIVYNISDSEDWMTTLREFGNYALDLLDLFKSIKSQIEQKNQLKIKNELGNIFDASNSLFEKSDIILNIEEDEALSKLLQIDVNLVFSSGKISIHFIKEKNDEYLHIFLVEEGNKESNIEKNDTFIKLMLVDIVSQIICKIVFNNVFIAPAERAAINIFSQQLSFKRNLMVDTLLEYKDKRKSDDILSKAQRYPLPIRDSLEVAENVLDLQKNKSDYSFFADRIEEELLKGKIKVSELGEFQFTPFKSKVKNLNIHLTSSIVKSLSNLVFYFRHLAKKGDFIIIDEPELNLHPDNQRKVARLFGEIINQGFKVMISTHSDYIIREINNLVMLKSGGEKANDLVKKYGYEEKQLIDHQRVGAYLFKNNRNYDIEVTETGFEVNTIDEEINNLNNASEEIYFTLFD